jgi:Uma2 family endonuclease
MASRARPLEKKTIADWLAAPEQSAVELIEGELIEKAAPDDAHADAQGALIAILRGAFNRRSGQGGPGGWWIRPEIDIRLGENGFRPDISGWRRDGVPAMPPERPVTVRPDWIAEVVSPSNARNDLITKMWRYAQAGVPHYWIIDPASETLIVCRLKDSGYHNVLTAERTQRVRAEPFEAIEIKVGLLFGDDPEGPLS